MKTFTKLLAATALVVSFAAPALASDVQFEGLTQAERNVYTNPKPTQNGSQAYAMATSMPSHKAHSAQWDGMAQGGKDLGAAGLQ